MTEWQHQEQLEREQRIIDALNRLYWQEPTDDDLALIRWSTGIPYFVPEKRHAENRRNDRKQVFETV